MLLSSPRCARAPQGEAIRCKTVSYDYVGGAAAAAGQGGEGQGAGAAMSCQFVAQEDSQPKADYGELLKLRAAIPLARPMACMHTGYCEVINPHTVGSLTIPRAGIEWV